MRVAETLSFKKAIKRLHRNQKDNLDEAIKAVLNNPHIGEKKSGDLAWLRVHKFRMANQLTLLTYELVGTETIILHGIGSHENFYRDLKI